VNGKVDRAALLAAERDRVVAPVPVHGGVRDVLRGLWCELLEVPDVSAGDNFFDAGGDSRSLALLAERVRQRFDRPIRVVDLMSHPTIAELADFLDGPTEAGQTRDDTVRDTMGAAASRRAAMRSRRRR
jgi:hypothetical protein